MEKNEEMTREFEQVVESTSSYLYSLSYRLTGSSYDAKDLLQDTYLNAWRNWHQLKNRDKALPWLRRICINLFIDGNKKADRRKIVNMVDTLVKPDKPVDTLTPEEEVLGDEAVKRFQSRCFTTITCTLPLHQRIVFVLVDIFELSIDETAILIQRSKSATKALLHRARKNMNTDMGPCCSHISTQNICRCDTWIAVVHNAEKRREYVQSIVRDMADKEFDQAESQKVLIHLFKQLPLLSPPELDRLFESEKIEVKKVGR